MKYTAWHLEATNRYARAEKLTQLQKPFWMRCNSQYTEPKIYYRYMNMANKSSYTHVHDPVWIKCKFEITKNGGTTVVDNIVLKIRNF